MASDEMTTWISGAALVISLASFGLSFYVFTRNARLTTQQKKMELLTRMREAQIQYSELNRRYNAFAHFSVLYRQMSQRSLQDTINMKKTLANTINLRIQKDFVRQSWTNGNTISIPCYCILPLITEALTSGKRKPKRQVKN